jgi:hypothetical protein
VAEEPAIAWWNTALRAILHWHSYKLRVRHARLVSGDGKFSPPLTSPVTDNTCSQLLRGKLAELTVSVNLTDEFEFAASVCVSLHRAIENNSVTGLGCCPPLATRDLD